MSEQLNEYMSVVQEAGHIKNTVVLIFRHIQWLHLMYSELAWVLVSSEIQVQPQLILVPDYLPDYLSFLCDYEPRNRKLSWKNTFQSKIYSRFSKIHLQST